MCEICIGLAQPVFRIKCWWYGLKYSLLRVFKHLILTEYHNLTHVSYCFPLDQHINGSEVQRQNVADMADWVKFNDTMIQKQR